MPYSIRVKQTDYDGHLFRSRTEARFAHLWNTLGIQYQYEPPCFEFPLSNDSPLHETHPSGTVKYIIDFVLNDQIFVEIKPKFPKHIECVKAFLLATHEKKHVYILWDLKKLHFVHFTPNGNILLGGQVGLCTVCHNCNLFKPTCPCHLYTLLHTDLQQAIAKTNKYTF